MRKQALLVIVSLLCIVAGVQAEKSLFDKKSGKRGGSQTPGTAANCTPPTASTELDINNTRALIQSGGDMWWDFNRARYEIPKGSDKTSLFAGSLWLAGQDVSGQFKVAALRFRQIGQDYWTGPLSTINSEIDPATCKLYDRQWETSRSMVAEFAAWWEAGQFDQQNGTSTQDVLYPGYTPPNVILEWPAHGRNFDPYNEDYYLAPFFDRDGDGDYDPIGDGDYPGYVLVGKSDCSRRVRDVYGDQNIWWVFNDRGNVHTESGGQAIGMEIRAQAFAFATTDEVNNMTFYNYELINRSTFELRETYFGQWVDGDLGNAQDDFVGCDVRRGLGYFYNGDEEDEDAAGNIGYGVNPPAIGVDFFQGPFQANDNLDNCLCDGDLQGALDSNGIVYSGQGAGYGDGIVDNERYGMRKFLYHNNAAGATGDPSIATDYYNLLRGVWKDGTVMTHGGNGYDPTNPNAIPAGYMFPGDTDPLNWGTDGIDPGVSTWTEVTAGNTPADRRFVQSSGPFTLGPGAVNNITVGVVWAQATEGGRLASVEVMRRADDKTQALFDSCFEILDGPDAPDVTVQELDREVILMLSNPANSNNFREEFERIDPFLAPPDSVDTNGDGDPDLALTADEKRRYATYKFEGYQIFQLADASVGTNDLDDPDKARLVAQVDIANDVTTLINYVNNSLLKIDEPFLKVAGSNEGIEHTFQITEDRFATGDNRLINHKTYYYMAVAYAYNRHGDGFGNLRYVASLYDPTNPEALDGQKLPYLASRKAPSGPVKVYEAIPHDIQFENDGTTLNSNYGDGVELVRIEGRGNGGNELVLSEETIERLFANGTSTGNWTVENAKYEAGKGPVNVKVVDPLSVIPGNWTLQFEDPFGTRDPKNYTWKIYGDGIADTLFSDRSIEIDNEQVLFELGLSVTGSYGWGPHTENAVNNGFIGFDVLYEDEGDQWLGGLVDEDANAAKNWIKSGTYVEPDPLGGQGDRAEDDHFDNFAPSVSDNAESLDPDQIFENIAGRTWAPFCMASYDTNHPIPILVGSAGYVLAENIFKYNGFQNTPSVEVVITKDKSKWTRCPVLEAQDNGLLTAGGAVRGELRRALSVDKQGLNQLDEGFDFNEATMNGTQLLTPSLVGRLSQEEKDHYAAMGIPETDLTKYSVGMGWFPGYAINLETGERMNMAFSEDSWLAKENGADMLWNPTSRETEGLFESVRYGGKHMVYVFRNNLEQARYLDAEYLMPAYDNGARSFSSLMGFDRTNSTSFLDTNNIGFKRYVGVFRAGAWVGYPMLNPNFNLFGASEAGNDVTIRLNVAKPYFPYSPSVDEAIIPTALEIGQGYYIKEGRIRVDRRAIVSGDTFSIQTVTLGKGQSFVAASTTFTNMTPSVDVELIPTINEGLPLYQFNTDELAPTISDSIGEDALGKIRVVPNPYYAYSEYETGRLDYEVKIINLPQKCNITIYTVDGTLVRTFLKDDPTITSVPWDLKNQDGIPIASGLYIIHVEVPGIGEKILKWFGVLRPIDLNSF